MGEPLLLQGHEEVQRILPHKLNPVNNLLPLAEARFELTEEIDLTTQVVPSRDGELDARQRQLRFLAKFAPLPGWRRVLDAFLGGIALERLYAKGSMRYRTMLAVCHGVRNGDRT